MDKRRLQVWKAALLAVTAGIFLLLFVAVDLSEHLRPDALREWLDRWGNWAPLLYMAVMALVVLTPLPSLPLNFAAGVYFGPLIGTLYSVAGATGGAVISFLLARHLGRELIERHLRGHILVCRECSDKFMSRIVFLGRLVPVVSFDLISYSAGLTAMSLRSFALANFFGMLPLTFVYNYFGAAISPGRWTSIVLGAVFVALFLLLPKWIEEKDLFSLGKHMGENKERKEPTR